MQILFFKFQYPKSISEIRYKVNIYFEYIKKKFKKIKIINLY